MFKRGKRLVFVMLLLVMLIGCTSKNRPDAIARTWDSARWDEAKWR